MGLAQGEALRDAIRAEVARQGLALSRGRWPSLRAVVSGPLRGQGAGRELFRHFAHQAERLEGLAQAAELPLDSLLALQLALHDPFAVDAAAVSAARVPSPAEWIVRESRPVVGFRSLEVTLPWLVPAFAGVNAAGLAVAVEPETVADEALQRDPRGGGVADAPAILLVQDCLARFEHVAGALDWCCKRPASGALVLAFADATGARARIVVSGRERRVEARVDGAGGEAGLLECGLGRSAGVSLAPARRSLRLDARGDGRSRGALEQALAPHEE